MVTSNTPTNSTTTPNPPRAPARVPRADPAERVVGYYAGWEHGRLPPGSLPVGLLTHVNYAFASVTADSRCVLDDPTGQGAVIAALQAWKRTAGVQTLLAVGGWEGSEHFSAAAATAHGRDALAESCVALARRLGFDGIDLDWEYPSGGKWWGRIADPRNHLELVGAFRSQLGVGELLTVAMPASPAALETFAVARIAELVDWINVMAYDLAGLWDDTTGHNAPIRAAHGPFGASHAVAHYELQGVPPAKLVLGVPFYGHAYANVEGTDGASGGMHQPYEGTPRGIPGGAITYRAIEPLVGSARWQRRWDPLGQVPWLVDPGSRQVISYDDPESIRAKVAFAREEGLAGIMVWELSGDTARFTLLRALGAALGR